VSVAGTAVEQTGNAGIAVAQIAGAAESAAACV